MNSEIKPICLNSKGGRNGVEGLQPSLNDRVYDSDGIATACTTSPFFMPHYTAVAMRGRYNENGEVEQQVEISNREVANAITTVQKDSMVSEPVTKVICETRYDEGIRFFENDICGSPRTIDACGNKAVIEADSVENLGGRTREIRGNLRIRKLTPKECWRLMGFTDEDFEKAEQVCSNTQLYKQAGNSICVPVTTHILQQLLACGVL